MVETMGILSGILAIPNIPTISIFANAEQPGG